MDKLSMNEKQGLVSVVVPFYKELDLIGRAVASVETQVLPREFRVEIIIGNDGSFSEDDIRSRLSSSQNALVSVVKNLGAKGAGNARNVAMDASNGQYIAFLDADDYWCAGKLARQIELVKSGVTFVAGGYMFEGSSAPIFAPTSVASTRDLLLQLRVSTSSVLMSKQLCAKERFSNLRFSQDTEYWARLAGLKDFRYGAVADVVAMYAPSGRTANKFVQAIAFRKIVVNFDLSLWSRLMIYSRYAVRGLLNHYVRR